MDVSRQMLRILIVPDKFKGTLNAPGVAEAISRGWSKARPADIVESLPMSDGGDGFGEVLSTIEGAKLQQTKTVNAAGEPARASWWWNPRSKTAIVESAKVIGLAMLPPGKFHPFQLDTFGLGKILQAAAAKGATKCIFGVGGTATNDGGFGMARALGWRFLDNGGNEIANWTELAAASVVRPPRQRRLFRKTIVAVDVQNPLVGQRGCSAVYGPQKGLGPNDIPVANAAMRHLARLMETHHGKTLASTPGAGAGGGLGFGLMAFLAAKPQSGFDIFATASGLQERIKDAHLVITGEGAIDKQTLMGKGVGQVALLCQKAQVPCIGLAGVVTEPNKAQRLFTVARGLVEITGLADAKQHPAKYLQKLATLVARQWAPDKL